MKKENTIEMLEINLLTLLSLFYSMQISISVLKTVRRKRKEVHLFDETHYSYKNLKSASLSTQ